VRYDEIRKMIISSSPDDWALIEVTGDVYLERFEVRGTGDETSLDVEGHTYLAVYKDDVDLRLAWGMRSETGLTFEGWDFPDRSIDREYVDGFWRGALVIRWPVLAVDGHRCYLPSPQLSVFRTESESRDDEVAGTTVKASDVGLARLLHRLVGRDDREFDANLRLANAVEVPDEDPA
jgi:hypothetical protein